MNGENSDPSRSTSNREVAKNRAGQVEPSRISDAAGRLRRGAESHTKYEVRLAAGWASARNNGERVQRAFVLARSCCSLRGPVCVSPRRIQSKDIKVEAQFGHRSGAVSAGRWQARCVARGSGRSDRCMWP